MRTCFIEDCFRTSLSYKIIIYGGPLFKIIYLFFIQICTCQDKFDFDYQKFKMTIKTLKKLLLN